jgi:hypothetical protein
MKKTLHVGCFAGAAVLATEVLTPGLAHALSCATNEVRAPRGGESAVPTNAMLWGYETSFARLRGPDGEIVPVETRAIPVAHFAGDWFSTSVLAPLQPLTPNANYTIEVNYDAPQRGVELHFSTGSGPTSSLPALPTLLDTTTRTGQTFDLGISRFLELTFEHEGILIGDAGGLGVVSSAADLFFDGTSLDGDDDKTPRVEWVEATSRLDVGVGDCMVWPEGAGDRQNARFGVLDLAGNFSGWVDTELELPSEAEALAGLELPDEERADEEAAGETTEEAAGETTEAAAYGPPPVLPSNDDNSSLCNVAPGGVSGSGTWLTLAIGSVLAAGRRFRRASR